MPFFSLRHNDTCNDSQRLVEILCLEASHVDEVIDRARYFGITFGVESSCGPECCWPEWEEPVVGVGNFTEEPSYRRMSFDYWANAGYTWAILYRDGRMTHSEAGDL